MTAVHRQREEPDRPTGECLVTHLVAYVDLGSGSLIVQLIIATIVAAPFFLRSQIRQLVASLRARMGIGSPDRKDGPSPG
jgi:hypothetical protein